MNKEENRKNKVRRRHDFISHEQICLAHNGDRLGLFGGRKLAGFPLFTQVFGKSIF